MSTRTFAALCILLPAFTACEVRAAELRTSIGERTIYRTVAFEDTPLEPAVVPPSEVHDTQHAVLGAAPCAACDESDCFVHCLRPSRTWAELEYLLWWRRGGSVPALVTTSPAGTPLDQAGVLGLSSTTVLFGNDRYGEDARPGGRVTIGIWLDECECTAVESRFYALGRETVSFDSSSDGEPILARPFDNQDPLVGPLGPTSRPIAFPGIATGNVFVRGESEVLGGDVLFRRLICDTGSTRIDLLGGYQYSRIDEDLTIGDSLIDVDPGNVIADGTRQDIFDRFETSNQFHGGLVGMEATYFGSCWRLELLAKVAFGNMRQVVNIMGQTINDVPNDPNSPSTVAEGLLANNGNQGRRQRDEFAVVPEVGATMTFQMTECFDLALGYSFLYWSNVVQPGPQIDQNLFVPSQFSFNDNSYWVHGLNFGGEFRF